ncbi:MAG: hypothetical protein ABIO43_08215 [Sphingomicrobium sp.]
MSAFWKAHPDCEAELRALHALLSEATPNEPGPLFGAAGEFDSGAVMFDLVQTRVSLDVNIAAQVVKISDVSLREVD